MQLENLTTQDYESLLQISEAEQARRDPGYFAEYILTDEENRNIVNCDMHWKWHHHVENNKNALIEAPRDHGKTEQMAVAKNIWKLGKNPNKKIAIVGANDEEAEKRGNAIKEHIESNEKVHRVFPKLKPNKAKGWTASKMFVKRDIISKDSSIICKGILSSATGSRATDITYDDVCDLKNSILEPKMRESIKFAFLNMWSNVLYSNGHATYIFTPWHQDDLSQYLKKHSEWNLLSIIVDDELNSVWEERWPKERLETKRREIGDSAFARGFQGKPRADKDMLFGQIETCCDYTASLRHVMPHWPKFMGIDLAISLKETADWVVLFTLALDDEFRLWVVDIQRGHWRSNVTAKMVVDTYNKYKHVNIMVENNAYQDAFRDWFADRKDIPLKPYTTGKQKFDEAIGLPSFEAAISRGELVIPMGDRDHPGDCTCNLCIFIDEMKTFPIGKHDDTVMASFFAREASINRNEVRVWSA